MPSPITRGIIVTLSIIVAAGLAAYENPQIREWIDRSRQRIAVALHSLGDDINPQPRSPQRPDPSMREDHSEMAETRRRQARAEILERGRLLEERQKRTKLDSDRKGGRIVNFDNLVDGDGILKVSAVSSENKANAASTSSEAQAQGGMLIGRLGSVAGRMHESVDSPMSLRQLGQVSDLDHDSERDPFADRYEQEMRSAWNMPLREPSQTIASSHTSESLIDLTPTSETAPDPAISVPDSTRLQHPLDCSEYFSASASASSGVASHGDSGNAPTQVQSQLHCGASQLLQDSRLELPLLTSSGPSLAGSIDHIHVSEVDETDDEITSEFGDGIRTPASAWTEVGSAISDFEH